MSLSESLRFTFINLIKHSTKTMWKPILYLGIPISKEWKIIKRIPVKYIDFSVLLKPLWIWTKIDAKKAGRYIKKW